MHPARHRALRELGAFARQMSDHWETLAGRLDGRVAKVLSAGATAADDVLGEVREMASARDLAIGRAALSAGKVTRARPLVPDAVLERNQAVRHAVLDAEHLHTLISYVGALSAAEGDEAMHDASAAWAKEIRRHAKAAKRAAIALGKDPDKAIEPISRGQRLTWALGWLGEATDRRRAKS